MAKVDKAETATGELIPAVRDDEELGASGLKGSEPYGGWIYEEFLPPLRGMEGAKKLKEMADNDPMCGAVLFALESLMKNVQWTIAPKDESTAALEARDYLEGVLFHDMMHPFGQLVDEACSMLTYGYSPHEIIYKTRDGETDDPLTSSIFADGLFGIAALPVRSQETIWKWIFDVEGRGHLLGLEQFRMSFSNAKIPISKLLLFRTQVRRNNPEGFSILRRAYVPYSRKKVIEESEGKKALRSAGIVTLRIPGKFLEAGVSGTELSVRNAWRTVADKLAQDRQGSVILPSDRDDKGNYQYVLEYTTAGATDAKASDLSPIIDRYDARIAVQALADFLLLGTKGVGSWALADSKTSLFSQAADSFLAVIAEQFNRVLVPKLWRLNAMDPETKPTLKAGSVQKPDLERIGTFLQGLARSGAAIFPSPDGTLEQQLLHMAGLPSKLEEG